MSGRERYWRRRERFRFRWRTKGVRRRFKRMVDEMIADGRLVYVEAMPAPDYFYWLNTSRLELEWSARLP